MFVPSREADSAEQKTAAEAHARRQRQGVFVAGRRAAVVVLPRPFQAGQPGTPAWVEEEGQEKG